MQKDRCKSLLKDARIHLLRKAQCKYIFTVYIIEHICRWVMAAKRYLNPESFLSHTILTPVDNVRGLAFLFCIPLSRNSDKHVSQQAHVNITCIRDFYEGWFIFACWLLQGHIQTTWFSEPRTPHRCAWRKIESEWIIQGWFIDACLSEPCDTLTKARHWHYI